MSGKNNKEEKVWMSMNALVKLDDRREKNAKTAKSTKRAKNKVSNNGKYIIKYDVDGVKHMILKG